MIGEPQLLTGRTHDIIIVAPKPSDSIVVCFFIGLEGRRGRRGSLTDFMRKTGGGAPGLLYWGETNKGDDSAR